MKLTSAMTRTTGGVALALLMQLSVIDDAAQAQWRRPPLIEQDGGDEVFTYAAGAALVVGGYFVYRKYIKKRAPKRASGMTEGEAPRHTLRTTEQDPLRPALAASVLDSQGTDEVTDGDTKKKARALQRMTPDRLLVGWDEQRKGPAVRLRWKF